MGTRHLICIWYQGKFVIIQYGQWDGYPSGQGVTIKAFLSDPSKIELLKLGLPHLYTPTEQELADIYTLVDKKQDEADRSEEYWSRTRDFLKELYPSLSRETSAGILDLIVGVGLCHANESQGETDISTRGTSASNSDEATQVSEEALEGRIREGKLPVRLDWKFVNEGGLFNEWTYVIDLDTEVLEVYSGGEDKHDTHRFKDVGTANNSVCALMCSISFHELQGMSDDDFVDTVDAAVKKRIKEEEEDEEMEEEAKLGDEGYGEF